MIAEKARVNSYGTTMALYTSSKCVITMALVRSGGQFGRRE